MATTAISVTPGPSFWSTVGKAGTETAADAANGNHIAAPTDDMLVIFRNSGATGRLCTVTSVALTNFARTGDVSFTLAAGALKIVRLKREGWKNATSGFIVLSAAHAEVKISIFDLTQNETT